MGLFRARPESPELPAPHPFEVLIQHKRSGRILTAEILLEMEERNLTL
jgi:hypothetical protein